jgi:pimeloyl-ACP methyl ester carboxylesterase
LADIAPYVNTPQVARDMLAITKAAGFPKLSYWGVSYGTVLGMSDCLFFGKKNANMCPGMTFATLFPDNIGRLIVDGVVDADDYYAAEYRKNLQ